MRRIVIDNGTDKIVAGYSGDKPPEHVFRNVLGKPKSYGGKSLFLSFLLFFFFISLPKFHRIGTLL